MSIDLSRPLVPSMGQHDPLDGLVTYCELQAAAGCFATLTAPDLQGEIDEMRAICRGMEWATADTLGIGGLLCDAYRIAQLMMRGVFTDTKLLDGIIEAALLGLEAFTAGRTMEESARYRLAFRELGLAIGLKGVRSLPEWIVQNPAIFGQKSALAERAATLTGYLPLAEKVEDFWLDAGNRAGASWREHREINMVMLATSLAPDEFLTV